MGDNAIGEVSARIENGQARFDSGTIDGNVSHIQQTPDCEGDVVARRTIAARQNPGELA